MKTLNTYNMKTHILTKKLCVDHLNSGYSLLLSLRVWLSTFHAQSKRFFLNALAMIQAQLVSLVSEVNSNSRLVVALVLMLVVAPLSGTLHVFFDKSQVIEGWYFLNYFNLFNGLRGNLLSFFTILGIFFLFPARYKASYILSAPLGFVIADSIKKIMATTNEEYYNTVAFPYVVLGVCLVLGVLKSLDYFLYKYHHIKRKYWAHIVGIIRTPGIPADEKMRILEKEIKSVESNFYSIF